jgi:hypothetical protein
MIHKKTKPTWSIWVQILFYLNIAVFLFSLCVGLDKPAFLGMIMSLLYIFWYTLRENNRILFK